jgi:hypothetical protein
MKYHGSCPCKALQVEVEAGDLLEVDNCSCSVCAKSAYLHLIVSKRNFKLVAGERQLQTYTFNTTVAEYKFCKVCGIKTFYIARSTPDGYSVNDNCIEPRPSNMTITNVDGGNWEQNAATLAHKSK